jgi:hypothetical protein
MNRFECCTTPLLTGGIADGDAALQQRLGARVKAEIHVRPAHHIHHFCLELRVLRQACIDLVRGLIEELASVTLLPVFSVGSATLKIPVMKSAMRSARPRSRVVRRNCSICMTANAANNTTRKLAAATPARCLRTYLSSRYEALAARCPLRCVAVRYAWGDSPICNLFNKDGLPASPFRTDDWPGLTERH